MFFFSGAVSRSVQHEGISFLHYMEYNAFFFCLTRKFHSYDVPVNFRLHLITAKGK